MLNQNPPPTPNPQPDILIPSAKPFPWKWLMWGVGIFFFLVIWGLVFYLRLQPNQAATVSETEDETETTRVVNRATAPPPSATASSLLKTEYNNPFVKESQYSNPFETKNPFDALNE